MRRPKFVLLATMSTAFLATGLVASAVAGDLTSQDIENVNGVLGELQVANPSPNTCDQTAGSAAEPPCSALTDSVCSRLYNSHNNGNMAVPGGKILFGKSDKSDMSAVKKADIEALLNSENRLSPDLRKKGAPVLAELREIMSRERDSKAWYRQVDQVLTKWKGVIEDVSSNRAEKESPGLKGVKEQNLTIEQKNKYAERKLDLSDEIVKAKYESNPNWKRVKRIFAEVKSDLLDQIKGMSVSEELKRTMLQTIGAVDLNLPLPDPRVSLADDACATTERNAFFQPEFGTFTVCAGYFNGVQNDAAMYLVLAHELSHSIDPSAIPEDEWKSGPVGQVVAKLAGAKGPSYSCADWRKLRQGPLNISNPVREPASYPYRKLTDCFFPDKELKPFDRETVVPVAERSATQDIGNAADAQAFTKMALPTIQKDGKTVPNQFYMRPDRLYADQNNGIFPSKVDSDEVSYQVFTQSLACQREQQAGAEVDYSHASLESQKKMFTRAIQETKDVQQAIYQTTFSYCGRECPALVNDDISRDAEENFADWMAIRTFPAFLKRQKSEKERQDAAGLSFVLMCDAPGPGADAPWLTELEKKFSLEPHPDDRRRRLSVFTPDVAAVVGCKRDQDVLKGDSGCSL